MKTLVKIWKWLWKPITYPTYGVPTNSCVCAFFGHCPVHDTVCQPKPPALSTFDPCIVNPATTCVFTFSRSDEKGTQINRSVSVPRALDPLTLYPYLDQNKELHLNYVCPVCRKVHEIGRCPKGVHPDAPVYI
jgi:hypothetical protein